MLDFVTKSRKRLKTLVQKAPDMFEYQIYLRVRSRSNDQYAFIPLLKTIAYALPINNEYKGIKEALKKSAALD